MSRDPGNNNQQGQPPPIQPLPPGLIDPAGMTGFYPPGLLRGYDPFSETFQAPPIPQANTYDAMTGQPVPLPPPNVNFMLQKHLQPNTQQQYHPPGGMDTQQPPYQEGNQNPHYPPQGQ